MKIIVGKTAGFCFGVKRAVDGALEKAKNNVKTYCLGELVHNEQVIQKIKDEGITVIDDISEINEDGVDVIIRAHGISKEIYKIIDEKKLKVTDFTCPYVEKIHQIVEEYSKNGFYIFLVGSKIHPETIGTSSYCGKKYSIIESESDVDKCLNEFSKSKIKRLLVIVQTTFGLEKFENILSSVKDKIDESVELEIKNTICNATKIRQDETEDISQNVSCMIIVGGKNSSNTRKLYDISLKHCKNTFLVENESELDLKEIGKHDKIGIMAGTSTPMESIKKIVDTIKQKF